MMQPYLFPYPGYFDLVARTDRWVVFDTAQYIRHGWVNRNRVLAPLPRRSDAALQGWQYVGVPLRGHSRGMPIRDVLVDDSQRWRERLLGQLGHYRRHAPHYGETVRLVERCLAPSGPRLLDVLVHSLQQVCEHLGLDLDPVLFSDLDVPTGGVTGPGDWALVTARHLGAAEYWNPPGGAGLFDPGAFAAAGVELRIQSFDPLVYPTGPYRPVANLSIVDALMWCSPDEVLAGLARPVETPVVRSR